MKMTIEGLGYLTEVKAITKVTNNNSMLETVLTIKLDDLSKDNQDAILKVLQKHVDSLGISDTISLLNT